MNKRQLNFKNQLENNLKSALLQPYPQYWLDAIDFALHCVQESYPLFNSHSTVTVTRSCGHTSEIEVHQLYNGIGVIECYTCNKSRIGKNIQTPEERSAHGKENIYIARKSLTEEIMRINVEKALSGVTPETRRMCAEIARSYITPELRKEIGRSLGSSGLGNLARKNKYVTSSRFHSSKINTDE